MNGIAIAGSILVDKINEIKAYPQAGELTQIQSVMQAVGGCVPNVGIDIKRMHPDLTVKAVGKIGKDADGEFVNDTLANNGVLIGDVRTCDDKTSFTEVMSVKGGQRTFFTYAGASAQFGFDDFDFDSLQVKMLHLGYFLLLDKIDAGDGLRVLQEAKARGIKTSIDLVSENSNRYALVLPCLPYVDNLIINEVEAGALTGIEPKAENLREIAEKLMSYGVKERVIIHMPDVGVCLSKNGLTVLPSLDLPKGFIKGTTGAGDAFCAGALIGIYEDESDENILRRASLAAAAALSETDAISGMKDEKTIEKLYGNIRRKEICSLI